MRVAIGSGMMTHRPFGHGESFTTFELVFTSGQSQAQPKQSFDGATETVSRIDGVGHKDISLTVELTNTGLVGGDCVVSDGAGPLLC
jgi:hypothetical protein